MDEGRTMQYRYLIGLGDSIMFGARDEYHSSPGLEATKLLRERTGVNYFCITRAISGETTGQLLKRVYDNLHGIDATIVLCLIGTNNTKPGKILPLTVYNSMLQMIKTVCHAEGKKVIFGQIPFIRPGQFLGEYNSKSNEKATEYNSVIRSICPHAPNFYELFRVHPEWIPDGIHPNNAGNVAMGKLWVEAIMSEL